MSLGAPIPISQVGSKSGAVTDWASAWRKQLCFTHFIDIGFSVDRQIRKPPLGTTAAIQEKSRVVLAAQGVMGMSCYDDISLLMLRQGKSPVLEAIPKRVNARATNGQVEKIAELIQGGETDTAYPCSHPHTPFRKPACLTNQPIVMVPMREQESDAVRVYQ